MSRIEVVMPQMGESIAEGTIVKWHKKVGETVKKDETLLEISTDKVDSEIPSPAAGTLAEIVVPENQTVSVRTVIGYLETDGGAMATPAAAGAPAKSKEAERATPRPEPEPQKAEPAASDAAQATSSPSRSSHAAGCSAGACGRTEVLFPARSEHRPD